MQPWNQNNKWWPDPQFRSCMMQDLRGETINVSTYFISEIYLWIWPLNLNSKLDLLIWTLNLTSEFDLCFWTPNFSLYIGSEFDLCICPLYLISVFDLWSWQPCLTSKVDLWSILLSRTNVDKGWIKPALEWDGEGWRTSAENTSGSQSQVIVTRD